MIEIICIFIILMFSAATLIDPFMGLIALTITLYFKLAGLSPIFYQLHVTRWFGFLILLLILIRGRKEINLNLFRNKQSRLFLGVYLMMWLSIFTSILGADGPINHGSRCGFALGEAVLKE